MAPPARSVGRDQTYMLPDSVLPTINLALLNLEDLASGCEDMIACGLSVLALRLSSELPGRMFS